MPEEWWNGEISEELERSLAGGGVTPRDLDPAIGEFLRRVSKIETVLAGAAMAYFRPADDERAAELEALFSFHLSFDVLIQLVPRFVEALPRARQEWVARQSSALSRELEELRVFRNSLAHGDLWWDFDDPTEDGATTLKVYSYSRKMQLKSSGVSRDVMARWIGRAAEACTVVGQIHYWISSGPGESDSVSTGA